jgi:AcrR family transcriptional regulator
VITDGERQLRADAARNADRIVRAARDVYADLGPDAPLEEIARRAGVGIRTLYRRFPHKEELVRATLELSITEQLSPTIERALDDDDPRRGLITLIEATLRMVAREQNTIAAARNAGTLTAEVTAPVLDSLTLLTRRAQEAGLVRADLVPEDVHRIMGMLTSVLWGMDSTDDGWRRYVTLMMDALTPTGASPLPPAVALLPTDSACRPLST